MAVLLETSKGDIVIDLFVEDAPMTCKNFLKLCKVKYYNNSLFHNVQRDFLAQTGDPTGTGKGGDSIYGMLYGSQARFFDDEISPKRRHGLKGCVGMASAGRDLNASQFYITLGSDLSSLDEKHTLFGQVSEGLEVLESMNEVPVDTQGRPMQNIRIRHTIVLDDPFDDPPQLDTIMPDASPPPTFEHGDRLEEDWVHQDDDRPAEEIEKEAAQAEAKNRAVVLEMIGDLPEADVKPPSNMLFVCKLNPVTTEEDLEIIFSRFGNVTSCDIIRDHKTGDSLCYAFIGYDNDQACEAAYFKMNNVLIDDRRIRVDFSQSVSHIWKQFRRHGKAGGNAGTAAEADSHERGRQGTQQGQATAGPASSRYIQLQGAAGQRDRGMLFDHDAQPPQQQHVQPPQQQRDRERRQEREAQQYRPGSAKRSRSRSRGRQRSVSRERSRSRERSKEHKHKKHKKQHKHERDYDRDERERSPGPSQPRSGHAYDARRGTGGHGNGEGGEDGGRGGSRQSAGAAGRQDSAHREGGESSRGRGYEGDRSRGYEGHREDRAAREGDRDRDRDRGGYERHDRAEGGRSREGDSYRGGGSRGQEGSRGDRDRDRDRGGYERQERSRDRDRR